MRLTQFKIAFILLSSGMWSEKVIGLEALKERLQATIQKNRVSHAQLFLGKSGYGTLPLAIGYAEMLLVHASSNESSCRSKIAKLVHPDLHFAFPVNTTKRVSKDPIADDFISDFRAHLIKQPYTNLFNWLQTLGIENKQGLMSKNESQKISQKLSLKPFEADLKVLIMWMPEKLNASAANKLLKLIEEPPLKTVFILVAEDEDSILTTIKSRTQIVRVPPIATEAIAQALNEQYELDPELAQRIAGLSDGDFGKALSMIAVSDEEAFDHKIFIEWMRHCYTKNFFKISSWVNDVAKIGRERQKNFIGYGLHIFRECLMQNYADQQLQRLRGNEEKFVQNFSPYVNSANALDLIHEFEKAAHDIERNGQPKIIFTDLSLKVMKLLTLKP